MHTYIKVYMHRNIDLSVHKYIHTYIRYEEKTLTISSCRLCKTNIKGITHIISTCPIMSSRYYLPLRHDPGAKVVYLEQAQKNTYTNAQFRNENIGDYEYWWNVPIKTSTKLPQ